MFIDFAFLLIEEEPKTAAGSRRYAGWQDRALLNSCTPLPAAVFGSSSNQQEGKVNKHLNTPVRASIAVASRTGQFAHFRIVTPYERLRKSPSGNPKMKRWKGSAWRKPKSC